MEHEEDFLLIPLSQNKFAIVDRDDYENLMKYKWTLTSKRYASCFTNYRKTRKMIIMHRLINNTPEGMETDHINGNTLDNRKKNLRTVTSRQNQMNKRPTKRGSAFKGATFETKQKIWRAFICINGKVTSLGRFKCELDAATAYNFAAYYTFGEYARYNTHEDVKK